MSRPEPAAAAAGASATKIPAPIIEPSPIVTASAVPSRRCSTGPSGLFTGRILGQAPFSSPNSDSRPQTVAAMKTRTARRIEPIATMGIAQIRRTISAVSH